MALSTKTQWYRDALTLARRRRWNWNCAWHVHTKRWPLFEAVDL